MSLGIYSKGEDQFLPNMRGVDPLIVVFQYPKRGSSARLNSKVSCTKNVGFDVTGWLVFLYPDRVHPGSGA